VAHFHATSDCFTSQQLVIIVYPSVVHKYASNTDAAWLTTGLWQMTKKP